MLCAVGDLVEDVVVTPDGPLVPGGDRASRITRRRGGSGATVAHQWAAHGRPARFVSRVGADALGDRLVADLAADGVDACVQRVGRTGTVVVVVDGDGERSFFTDRGSSPGLGPAEERWLDGVAVLHLPAYSLAGGDSARTCRTLARWAHERGIAVSLDPSSVSVIREVPSFPDLLAEVAPAVVFPNRDEAAEADCTGPWLTVTKAGARPTVVEGPGIVGRREVPVPPVEGVTDTTGAGDRFAAGWLAAWLDGADPVAACEQGHAWAAIGLAGSVRGGAP